MLQEIDVRYRLRWIDRSWEDVNLLYCRPYFSYKVSRGQSLKPPNTHSKTFSHLVDQSHSQKCLMFPNVGIQTNSLFLINNPEEVNSSIPVLKGANISSTLLKITSRMWSTLNDACFLHPYLLCKSRALQYVTWWDRNIGTFLSANMSIQERPPEREVPAPSSAEIKNDKALQPQHQYAFMGWGNPVDTRIILSKSLAWLFYIQCGWRRHRRIQN